MLISEHAAMLILRFWLTGALILIPAVVVAWLVAFAYFVWKDGK